MRNNNTRTKAAFMKFIAVPLITVAVGGCGADTIETESPAGDQVEVLELDVENDQ